MKHFSWIRHLLIFIFYVENTFSIISQSPTQSIKGVVRDMDSQVTLPGATVVILGTNPVIGIMSDAKGEFRLNGVPVGRYNIQVSFVGYEPAIISEVLVQSGKEVFLQIELKESTTTIKDVEVKAYSNKEHAVNPMAMISSRQLTMEEASRYAGGIDDPSRLASSFAGVAGSLSSNAIVIRGNAPKGLLWRMEGIEIPNPSHFANVSTFGGGGITSLSSQMLSNSDFYTGAFPAEFGNALSGVFDMRIRNGNNEKREHTIKAGIIGIDFATEGPFLKGHKSSYLMNYRYSTLALISPLLPENARGIKYQDLSFKFNFPLGKSGTISAWGIYSADRTGSEVQKDSTQWKYYQDIEHDVNKNRMGAGGVNYKVILSEKTYLNLALAATGNFIYWHRDRLDGDLKLYPRVEISQNDRKYSFSFMVNHKFGLHHTNRSGFNINRLNYSLFIQQVPNGGTVMLPYAGEEGGSSLIQIYTQSRIDLHNRLTVNAGIHSQWFSLNHNFTLEPRTSVTLKMNQKNSISLAYGLHSRMEPLSFYFSRQATEDGISEPNRNLRMSLSNHFVLSYELAINDYCRLRIEPYYQYLYHVPVIPNSTFSMLNLEMDWFFNDSLVNKGRGKNVGLDITYERFLHNGFYYLLTGSVFDSKYAADDGVWRNSRFNKNVVVNLVAGKEWVTGRDRNHVLGLNGKFSILGGDRYTPVNKAASLLESDVVYDDNRAFENRKPTVYYLDFSASFQTNKKNHTSTWSFQFVNSLFQKEFYGHRFNFRTKQVEPQREIVVIPNFSYRIDF